MPWILGPPDGRYLARRIGDPPDAPAAHVLLFATFGAPERRSLGERRRRRPEAAPEPPPAPVSTGRATVISVATPFAGAREAEQWLRTAGEEALAEDLHVLNQTLHAYRLITADPYRTGVGRGHVLVARLGFGAGEEVAEGRWTQARELLGATGRERRAKVLQPQARLAAVLGRREHTLACEELALRAHLDLDQGRPREAALQVLVALDSAVAELSVDPVADKLRERIEELRGERDAVGRAAQAALAGGLSEPDRETVASVLGRIEAALRARAVANA